MNLFRLTQLEENPADARQTGQTVIHKRRSQRHSLKETTD